MLRFSQALQRSPPPELTKKKCLFTVFDKIWLFSYQSRIFIKDYEK